MSYLTWFQIWMLKRIIHILVYNFREPELFRIIYAEHKRAFYEDNIFTRQEHMSVYLKAAFLNVDGEVV